ncbi:hypothetical protein JIG36_38095 [Actinoplanes sp. LDG1-06]|uniref:Uncharacterized protein n=1 Tax=Paractinoplanes ovalisporus TaxID=2810368 RepID=A0ABS2ANC8_9ACTN|nr:hypothetical protein [Actinoplanes ovalisporus]MBM2621330.1 hypothetical protein [Actinoplanes ovalisporus]
MVHDWDEPAGLSSWEGAQYFGQGNESSGQRYEVRLSVVPMSAATDFHEGRSDQYGVEPAELGAVLDTVLVDRVDGEAPTTCTGR